MNCSFKITTEIDKFPWSIELSNFQAMYGVEQLFAQNVQESQHSYLIYDLLCKYGGNNLIFQAALGKHPGEFKLGRDKLANVQ